ncbi:hypothetical protein EXVG_00106 [Emiliania huxleyi virus 202]|nr:hypothetical protein EXVG_00106 [Emiliania huxleyi virus 202]AHA54441.1 hypothetical protein EhV18_00395 [Emiliania huxleyi virus 18]AHA55482.1 hypothetical protein EhV156_00387 [Emiliania huxleyi virus 156]
MQEHNTKRQKLNICISNEPVTPVPIMQLWRLRDYDEINLGTQRQYDNKYMNLFLSIAMYQLLLWCVT